MNMLNRAMHRWIFLPVSILVMAAVVLGAWAFDREPPLVYKGNVRVEYADDHVVRISYDVQRKRFCDLTVVRSVRDADGYRWSMSDREYSAPEVREIEGDRPGRVLLVLPVPKGARRGAMVLRVVLRYECNPVHILWPIRVAFSIPFYSPGQ